MSAKSLIFTLLAGAGLAQALEPIQLPKPATEGGKPLMQALNERKSGREYSAEKLSPQVLSNLLWAAFGINRPDGRRTAPSASNRQTIDIYAVLPDGAYLYDAKQHRLVPVAEGDLRPATATQAFAAQAPLNLVFTSDYSKMSRSSDADKLLYSGTETGFISQNVYLYCASEGLATVVRASVDRDQLAKALKLKPEQKITLAQSVGYPKRGS